MRFLSIAILIMTISVSCQKKIALLLPAYDSQITMEMYLEQGTILKCLLTESLPYTDTVINRPLDDAMVIFSDGFTSDTLQNKDLHDWEYGRWYNYALHKRLAADTAKTYTLTIADKQKRTVKASTRFNQRLVYIDKLISKPLDQTAGRYSVGVVIQDPPGTEDFYRLMIAKQLNDFNASPTDMYMSDLSFNGKSFSIFSEEGYAKGDTVIVRLYSLQKEHYDYVQSVKGARLSNFNPLVQPSQIKSNIEGGLGIFAAIRFDQKQIIIR